LAPAAIVLAAACVLAGCSSGGAGGADAHGTASASGLGKQYLAIANPANEKLDHAFDALKHDDHTSLTAAHKDLSAAAVVERAFDRSLLEVAWPVNVEATAQAMVKANEARASITEQAAAAPTLAGVMSYEQDMDVGNQAVERWVDTIRVQLALPPPDTD
jgi:hypothetical protein